MIFFNSFSAFILKMDFQKLKNLQGKVHFIGLGGIGMSALALILREFNIAVQGSDLSENYLKKITQKKHSIFLFIADIITI